MAHSNGDGRRPPAATCGRGHGEKLSRRQNAAIAALLAEPTIGAAAGKAKVGERTLRRWMMLPAFSREYTAARDAALDSAVKLLQVDATEAVEVLLEIARDKTKPAAARVSASATILTTAMKATELRVLNSSAEYRK
jgi:hypothetical protein